ncbi:MAG: ribonuclease HI [Proteobacteria bacterium]|nr:ribonuclease HI [Pseudomonadota bacterium]
MTLSIVKIYTDGSCSPNPGPGGWGVVILPEQGKKVQLSGREEATTNNRMELQAALAALASLGSPHCVELYTDSKYVQKGITSWIDNWRKNNWLTAEREPVKNQDLWESLAQEMERHQVHWFWVKGHADNPYNEEADVLAAAARGRTPLPLSDETAIHIFLGITWKQKTHVGSWAAVLRYQDYFKVIGEGVEGSTANRVHIQASVCALRSLKRLLPVHIYTSSGYLKDGASNWVKGWAQNGWLTREGKEVSNREEWKQLTSLLQELTVSFHVIDRDMPPCHSQEAKELAREWVLELEGREG